MNRCTLLVPWHPIDKPQTVQFMEFIAESSHDSGRMFANLAGLGLDKAISAATSVLRSMNKSQLSTALYWTNPGLNLTGFESVTLALILGVLSQEYLSGYERIIVSGRLNQRNEIVKSSCLQYLYTAILSLRQINSSSCLILPKTVAENSEQHMWLKDIKESGIDVYTVANLSEAIQQCFSPKENLT